MMKTTFAQGTLLVLISLAVHVLTIPQVHGMDEPTPELDDWEVVYGDSTGHFPCGCDAPSSHSMFSPDEEAPAGSEVVGLVQLDDCPIKPDFLAFMAAHPTVTSVEISTTDAKGWKSIEGLTQIQDLSIFNSTSSEVASACKLPHLRSLTLTGGGTISELGLKALAAAPSLQKLCLEGYEGNFSDSSPLSTHDIETLTEIESLECLDLNGCNLRRAGLIGALRPLAKLKALGVARSGCPDFRGIGKLQNLERLDAQDNRMPKTSLHSISLARKLRCLNLTHCTFDPAEVAELRSLSLLEELSLADTSADDTTGEWIVGLDRLTYLSVSGAKVGDLAMRQLARLRRLRLLDLSRTSVTDVGVAELANCKTLEALDLHSCSAVTDDSVPVLASMPSLKVLVAIDSGLSEDGIKQLRELRPLLDVR